MKTPWLALLSVTLGVGAGGACGGIERIDVHDERLPLDARLWVGGAEDAVAIAEAALEEAKARQAEVERWADGLPGAREVSPRGASLVPALQALAGARLRLAEAEVDHAEADVELARVSLRLVYAETHVRYDLGVEDLVALRATKADAVKDLDQAGLRAEEATVALDKVSADFWAAYRAHAQGGADDALVWLAQ